MPTHIYLQNTTKPCLIYLCTRKEKENVCTSIYTNSLEMCGTKLVNKPYIRKKKTNMAMYIFIF